MRCPLEIAAMKSNVVAAELLVLLGAFPSQRQVNNKVNIYLFIHVDIACTEGFS